MCASVYVHVHVCVQDFLAWELAQIILIAEKNLNSMDPWQELPGL